MADEFKTKLNAYLAHSEKSGELKGVRGVYGKLSAEEGSKYHKIVQDTGGTHGKSTVGFVDPKTGDVYKAAGQSPAKGVRGNIHSTLAEVEKSSIGAWADKKSGDEGHNEGAHDQPRDDHGRFESK